MNESGRVKVDVYNATNTLEGSYDTTYTIDDTYTFSGSELHLAGFAGSADFNDYT